MNNLWLYENKTLLAMLADAQHVTEQPANHQTIRTEAANAVAAIRLELEGRGHDDWEAA